MLIHAEPYSKLIKSISRACLIALLCINCATYTRKDFIEDVKRNKTDRITDSADGDWLKVDYLRFNLPNLIETMELKKKCDPLVRQSLQRATDKNSIMPVSHYHQFIKEECRGLINGPTNQGKINDFRQWHELFEPVLDFYKDFDALDRLAKAELEKNVAQYKAPPSKPEPIVVKPKQPWPADLGSKDKVRKFAETVINQEYRQILPNGSPYCRTDKRIKVSEIEFDHYESCGIDPNSRKERKTTVAVFTTDFECIKPGTENEKTYSPGFLFLLSSHGDGTFKAKRFQMQPTILCKN